MVQQSIERLSRLLESVPPQLRVIDAQRFSLRPAPGKWSKKEILGHLIDSATNNHQRFIRARSEPAPAIWYDQEHWVAASNYNSMDQAMLIDFWLAYNRHLLHIIRYIPAADFQKTCTMKDGTVLTLEFLVHDYVQHLEHHLAQLL